MAEPGDYPGFGMRMSVYGPSILNPIEHAGWCKSILSRQSRIRERHLAIKGDGSLHFPGVTHWTKEELKAKKDSYLGIRKQKRESEHSSTYDRLFHLSHDYDSTIHRDDRQHILKLGRNVHEEERNRMIGVLSSTAYGQRVHQPLETFSRQRVRIDRVLKGFSYRRGTGLPPINT